MDYNWLENTPQVSQGWRGALPIWQPDYSFLQSMDMRINQQFDQGVSKIANAYSLFNQPVLGDKARSVQQSYARQAQDRLKDLSSADLSDPKNVEIAENIMSPFYTDQNLLTNISYAKYYTSQDDKLDAWQNSTDKDVRAQYNDEMRNALQYKRQEYANAPYDKSAYNKIERISATPYFDINADIDKAYKDEQNKGVDNVSIIGSGIYTEHNGVKSLDSFRNYYLSKVGDKYNGQLKVHAYVTAQKYKQDILSHNPGLSSNEVDQRFAQENVDALSNSYKTNRDSYNKVGDYWEGRAQDILKNTNNGKTAGQEQLDKVKFYQNQAQAHRDEANKYDAKYQDMGGGDPNSDKYQKFFKELYEHPEQYIGDIDKQIRADNWAKGMAYMNTSEKVELDPVTDAYIKHREKNAELQIQQNQVNATLRGQAYSLYKETGRTTPGGPVDPNWNKEGSGFGRFTPAEIAKGNGATGGLNPDGTPNNNSWIPLGTNTTDLAHLSSDVLKKQQDMTAAGINNGIFDPQTGLATAFKATGLLNQNELIDFNNISTKMISGEKLTDDQNKLLDKVRGELKDKGVDIANASSIQGLQNALIQYATVVAGDLKKTTVGDNLVQKHMLGTQLAVTAGMLQQRMSLYNKSQSNLEQARQEELKKEEFKKLRYVGPDGKVQQLNPEVIAKDFPEQVELQESSVIGTMLKNGDDPRIKRLSGKDLAQLFYDGKYKYTKPGSWGWGSSDIVIDGKKYEVVGVKPQGGQVVRNPGAFEPDPNQHWYDRQSQTNKKDNPALNTFREYAHSVSDKYGDSKDFSELRNNLEQNMYKKLDITKNGMITPRYGIDPSDDKTEDIASRAGKEIGSTSIVPVIYTDNGKVASDDETRNLRQVLANTASTKAYISQIYRTNTANGADAYGVVIRPEGTQASKNESAMFSGTTYILPVSSLTNAPVLASIPQKTSFIFDEMYDPSKKLEADPVTKAYGQNFIVRGVDPGSDGKATAAYVMLYNSHPDPDKPGQLIQEPEKAYKIPLSGPQAKNSEEIMNFVYGRINAELNRSDAVLSKIQEDMARAAEAKKYETAIQK